MKAPDLTRRSVLGGTAAGLATLPIAARAAQEQAAQEQALPAPDMVEVVLQVNGQRTALTIEPRTTLLDALRETMELTGTKKGCGHGSCGACTVHINGKRVVSCLTLAVRCRGKAVVTIEGLAEGDNLHPMQAAFLEHDGLQCGYCTPGQIMSAVALVKEGHAGSADEIREWMSGNLCRCGAYANIVAAIRDASGIVSTQAKS